MYSTKDHVAQPDKRKHGPWWLVRSSSWTLKLDLSHLFNLRKETGEGGECLLSPAGLNEMNFIAKNLLDSGDL